MYSMETCTTCILNKKKLDRHHSYRLLCCLWQLIVYSYYRSVYRHTCTHIRVIAQLFEQFVDSDYEDGEGRWLWPIESREENRHVAVERERDVSSLMYETDSKADWHQLNRAIFVKQYLLSPFPCKMVSLFFSPCLSSWTATVARIYIKE